MLLIIDEAQAGLGKLGTMFACEQEGVVPDLMTISKHFGGGIEISAVITTPEIEEKVAQRGLVIGHSHTNDPLACNAAMATLDIIIEDNLPEKARRLRTLSGDRFIVQRAPEWQRRSFRAAVLHDAGPARPGRRDP
jgi:2,2-dialkylglycine decarboxylase (pyruvate)